MTASKGILIIAEAGVNHNGDMGIAAEMINTARECGADIIKFQTARPELMVSRHAEKADYQKHAAKAGEKQYDMLKRLMLSYDQYEELRQCCREAGIIFLSTPFDLESIDFLDRMDMPFFKIPSGEITDLPYLEKIGRTRKPVVLSTGMSTLREIGEAMKVLRDNDSSDITLLHCTTEYPAPFSEVNLKAMNTMKERFGVPVGYSDHTRGIETAIAAAALGAVVIEKHFTLDRSMAGPDHKASLEPRELEAMIRSIRNVEQALGSGEKEPTPAEEKNRTAARKSILAKRNIRKGEMLTEDNLIAKRPGNGISPMLWHEVLGKSAKRDFMEDELIEL